ncbi:SDR family oxidoreductase [Herbiconiux sp. KACC 21604]|uniref:SDR family oxidoreductase n=1 Tax=unclassified Herbiconiux TaxID=2618217 RepID=UPI001492B13D|nr:SDR family oxidoreductase [Herbiconiux sp. SALV-R1]QJU54254.1 SDR family oxidoreductase [Herbiconiux sp. SALV-R1]WPO85320.1 SDR family oxidoreductase [Herbiconiux sp. KACC 21604]
MHVFVTGASGWIGSAVIPELVAAGHRVTGLARSDASAGAVQSSGADVVRGELDDLGVLRAGADAADAVVHLGFKHDFTRFAESGRTERAVLETFIDALDGSERPLLFAAGVAGITSGRAVTENDVNPMAGPDAPRGGGEELALSSVARGVRPVALRFAPSVHGDGDHGFVWALTQIAREKGTAAYVGDGSNRWAAVYRSDAARLVRLALEATAAATPDAPAPRVVHAVAEEGVATRDIAAAIGRGLGLPVTSIAPDDAADHFGWMARFFGADLPASSTFTRERLGWAPTGPTLLDDLATDSYFAASPR